VPILQMRHVQKSYPTRNGPRPVLRDISLTLREGEFVCLVGSSGVGKTTLLSLVAGLLAPDRGEILLDGRPVDGPGPDRGLVFQNYSLLPWMTVFENVLLAVDAVAPGLTGPETHDRVERAIRLVNLWEAAGKRPRELSGGMRQRVAVARALAMDPKILLLDEPFSALDALTRRTLQLELTRIWAETGKTILMITNDVDEAILLADRVYPLTQEVSRAPATLGPEIAIPLARPRSHRLGLDAVYRRARTRILGSLLPGTGAPLSAAKPVDAGPGLADSCLAGP